MTQTRRKKPGTGIDSASLLEGLNPEQRAVALHHTGPMQVLAGAGSGKTHALVRRMAYLIAGHHENPAEICAVTFSKKAADEMNDRLEDLGIVTAQVGTWHSLAYQILKEERPEIRHWEVDGKDRFRGIVKTVLGFRGMKWDAADLTQVCSFIGLASANLAEPGTEAAMAVAQGIHDANPCGQTNPRLLCEAYERATEEANARQLLTFDFMILGAWRALQNPEARARWAARFKFVLQDEAQDCNLAQAELAAILASESQNYMIVGDPAQSIYGFRGAHPERFMSFPTDYPGTVVVAMNRNYRSGAEIIAAANLSAESMAKGTTLGVDMIAERGVSGTVVVGQFLNADEEGEAVIQRLQAAHQDGVDWKDMAVLYRTNAQSRGVEEACLRARVPYVVLGGTNFYDRREVKDLLSYLRAAAGRGGADPITRSMNAPFRFLGKVFQDRVKADYKHGVNAAEFVRRVAAQSGIWAKQKTAVEQWAGLIEDIAKSIDFVANNLVAGEVPALDLTTTQAPTDLRANMPAALLEKIIAETDYMRYLTRDEGAETTENNRVSNVRELVRAAERFQTVGELLDYVDQTIEGAKEAGSQKSNAITLCSLHRSKGLEWNTVAVVGCNEKILPHGRATDIEEERRLFYVGTTRARDTLHLSCVSVAAFGAKVVDLEPSRFLTESGLVIGEAA